MTNPHIYGVVDSLVFFPQIDAMSSTISVRRPHFTYRAHWLAFLSIGFVVAVIVWATHLVTPATMLIKKVEGTYTYSPDLAMSANWQPTRLPNHLCPPSEVVCYAHYRVKLADLSPTGDYVVFFPGYFGALGVSVNEQWLTSRSHLNAPIRRAMFDPLLVEIPSTVLRGEVNEMQIVVATPPYVADWIAPFYVGTSDDLRPAWQLSKFIAQDLLLLSNGVFLILMLLALMSYFIAGRAPMYLWFALLSFFASMRNLFVIWVDADLSAVMAFVYHFSTIGLSVAAIAFVRSFINSDKTGTYFLLLAGSVPLALLNLFLIWSNPYSGETYANNVTQAVVVIAAGVAIWHLMSYLRRSWNTTNAWISACFLGALLFVLHDVVAIGLMNQNVPAQLSGLSPLLIVVVFCLVLANRLGAFFAQTQSQAEALQSAVQARERDLYEAYEQLRVLEQKNTVVAERRRLQRDLHDGVGGRLAGLIVSARQSDAPELAARLEESLNDLRAVVDSLDDDQSINLGSMLTDLRDRLRPWIEHQNINHEWNGNALASDIVVEPSWRLNVARVLQEGISNIVRHARASQIRVFVNVQDSLFSLQIKDDGIGIDAEADFYPGNGIRNMQARVREMGGSLTFDNRPDTSGTILEFEVPLVDPDRLAK